MSISLIRIRAPMRYSDALDLQRVHGAELERSSERAAKLIVLQHTPVFTLGRRTEAAHLPINEDDLAARTGAEVMKTDRAGSVTYHAPGQVTAYLLLNLQAWGLNLHRHLDMLEESAIVALRKFGVRGFRIEGMTGVWINNSKFKIQNSKLEDEARKICSIGVSARRWVTYHGLSLNVDMDLRPFDEVIACGLMGKKVTSLAEVLGRSVDITEAESAVVAAFSEVFGAEVEIGMI
ncbi:MAG TPA: lipoyl(octanoyl) transferase LipB [Planctomycetota bacterium]|nr:lipoyl(octanoyl) transferase LipB [Planctomycetota bacterium]